MGVLMSQTEEAVLSRSKLKWASALQNASSLLLLLLLVLSLVVVGHYFIWHAQVLTDVDMDAVVSGQQQVTVKGEHMNVAQKSVMVLC